MSLKSVVLRLLIYKENSTNCYFSIYLLGWETLVRYFNKAVEVLYVKKCLSGNSISSKDSQGTIIFINGMSHKYGTEFQKNEKNGLFTNYVYIKI